jgi:hypothetical protein
MRLIGLAAILTISLIAPLAVDAQQAAKIARIGFLSAGSASDPRMPFRLGAFRQGLRDLGYVEKVSP